MRWKLWRSRAPGECLSRRLTDTVRARSPLVAALGEADQERLFRLASTFLVRKTITPVRGLELVPEERALVACLCCLPVLNLGGDWLGGWHEVVLYPGAFRVHRSELDEPTGVLHEWEDELAGEAWSAGPLILSWEDILLDQESPFDGCNVVAHEIAHKLDLRDGVLDGTPLLPAGWQRDWARDFQTAFDTLVDLVERGDEAPIDDYASTAPDEFFAVVSEYHFSAPAALGAWQPRIADHLRRFYGPSPFETQPLDGFMT